MRAMRTTAFIYPHMPPTTVVIRECDVIDTLESIRYLALQPGALVLTEIFDIENDATIEDVTLESVKRIVPERESNMAILFHWDADQLTHLTPHGVLVGKDPAPLTAEEIITVFEQLVNHPHYKGQTVFSWAEDGRPVKIVNGEVREEEL